MNRKKKTGTQLKLKKKEYVQNKIRKLKKMHTFLEIIKFRRKNKT